MLFLSLGSNYTFRQMWRHMCTIGRRKDSDALQTALIARYQGKKALLFARGRGALSEAVRLATGGQGSVAVTAMTCYVVIEAIRAAGCQPLYVDVNPQTLQFDASTLRQALQGRDDVRAIIVQNTLGIPVAIEEIMQLARQHRAMVIEDLAHAVGGRYADGREMGTVGDFTMLSFGRDKMIDAINGGALVIRTAHVQLVVDPPIDAVRLRWQLRDRLYPLIGWSARKTFGIGLGKYILALAYRLKWAIRSADGGVMPTVRLPHWQAKLALEQLQRIDQTVLARLDNQARYLKELAVLSPAVSSNGVRLPLLVENRQHVLECLERIGVFVRDIWYEVPVSPARLYRSVAFPEKTCPMAVKTAARVINLPTHQLVRPEQVAAIVAVLQKEARPWK